jgi:beta-N-acetylhexosaminidase
MSNSIPTLSDLSLEQKVGQVIMGGFPDPTPDAATLAAVRDGSLGNIILFARNCPSPAHVADLTRMLQAAAPLPLLIAADQEGGSVTRLAEPATVMPGAMALGATGDPSLAERVGQVMADEMRAVGVNVILAPVADVNANPYNPVIGVRSFGEDPTEVGRFVAATVRGIQAWGVASCAKHFPGHGDTSVDSHHDLPRIPHSLERLEQVELVPFRAAMEAGVDLIMTTHIVFPALDAERPSTLSRAILTGLLRERLGFEGVVITDSMEMHGILQGRTSAEACLMAFAAGADIVCPSHYRADQAGAHALILQAVEKGAVPLARLDQAVERILALKRRLLAQAETRFLGENGFLETVGSAEHLAVARQVAERAVTVVRDEHGWLPLPDGTVAVIEFGQPRFNPAEEVKVGGSALAGAVARHRPVEALAVAVEPGEAETAQALALAQRVDVVVIGTRSASFYPAQADLARRLIGLGRPAVVVALRAPYDLLALPEAQCFVAAYGDTWAPLAAAAITLAGQLKPTGTLPVNLPGLYPRGYGLRRVIK